MESKIKQANEEVKNLAEINLNYEGKLLLALADYLSDHRMLQKKRNPGICQSICKQFNVPV